MEIKRDNADNCYSHGMHKSGSKLMNGICRLVYKEGEIEEGVFLNGKLNGYCRLIFENGAYFIGMYKDDQREGWGKYVFTDGRVKEGIWKNNDFKG